MPPSGQRGNRGGTGRPPKATKLHVLNGTYREDKHGKRKDAPLRATSDGKLPPPPAHLNQRTREAWEYIASTLTFKIFSDDDVATFETFAAMWARWQDMEAHLQEHGVSCTSETKDGRVVYTKSPEATIWMDLNGKLMNYFGRFGMTPADRSRIKEHTPDEARRHGRKEENPDDEFAKTEEA